MQIRYGQKNRNNPNDFAKGGPKMLDLQSFNRVKWIQRYLDPYNR